MTRKMRLPLVLAGTVFFAVSCREIQVSMNFVTPLNQQVVTRGLVPIRLFAKGNNGYQIDSVLFHVSTTSSMGTDTTVASFTDAVGTGDTWRFTWDASSAGLQKQYYISADADKNHSPSEIRAGAPFDIISVIVDTGGPWIKMLSSKDGDSLARGMVPVTVRARDSVGGGMDRVEFYVDDVLGGTVTANAGDTYRWTWNDSQATAGGHSLKAKAYNQHGDKAVDGVTVYVRGGGAHNGPTYHFGLITADETWSPDGNPHIVSNVTIQNNALVTIMPGCTVKVHNGWGLSVGEGSAGGLAANGTAAESILFTSDSSTPHPGDWPGITLDTGTTSSTRFQFCTFEYGGNYLSGGNVNLRGNTAATMENCTIRNSAGAGVWCNSGWFNSFTGNTITGNATYPIAVTPDLVRSVDPGNDLSGNGEEAIFIEEDDVVASTTWPAQSLPYVLAAGLTVGGSPRPTLQIAAGSTLWFKQGGSLTALNGDIVADGSSGQITFEPDSGLPQLGKFYGIKIGSGQQGDTISGSKLINCLVQYGGNPSSPSTTGNIRVWDTRPVISGCQIQNGGGCGIVLFKQQVPDTAALRSSNSFSNNPNGDIVWYPN